MSPYSLGPLVCALWPLSSLQEEEKKLAELEKLIDEAKKEIETAKSSEQGVQALSCHLLCTLAAC